MMRRTAQIFASLAAMALIAAAPLDLCGFAKQVIAEKDSDFALLKGEALKPEVFHNETFKGTLKPAGAGDCLLNVRHLAGRTGIPPDYSCTLATSKNFAAANRVFARAATDLRACLPELKFAVMYDGDGKDPAEGFDWLVAGDAPGLSVELEMSNGVDLIAQSLSGAGGNPDIEVTIRIANTAPPGH
jgi:hypothetical protein